LWRLVTRLLGLGHLDKDGGKLYWCDREGMRVMRANLDGSQVETLVSQRGNALTGPLIGSRILAAQN
jgi:hypothetical protein